MITNQNGIIVINVCYMPIMWKDKTFLNPWRGSVMNPLGDQWYCLLQFHFGIFLGYRVLATKASVPPKKYNMLYYSTYSKWNHAILKHIAGDSNLFQSSTYTRFWDTIFIIYHFMAQKVVLVWVISIKWITKLLPWNHISDFTRSRKSIFKWTLNG
jgi:hypothetical protein